MPCALIGVLNILAYLPFNLKVDVMVQVLIKEAFSKLSLHNTSSSIGIGIGINSP